MNESLENTSVLLESSLENSSGINMNGQFPISNLIWIVLFALVLVVLFALVLVVLFSPKLRGWLLQKKIELEELFSPKLKGWLLQKNILQLAQYSFIFTVLGIMLCIVIYLVSRYIPNAELFLVDKDGRFNLTFITAIVAGIVFFARQEEEERKRKLELHNSFYNELVEVVTEYINAVEIVANDFFELNFNINRKDTLDRRHRVLEADWQAVLEELDNLPSDQQEVVKEALEKVHKQKVEMSLKSKKSYVDFNEIEEIKKKHQLQCKFILEDLNKIYTRLTIILNSEGISEDVCTDCGNLNGLLNKIRKDYDGKLRDFLVGGEVTREFVTLISMMQGDIERQKMIVEDKLKKLIKKTRDRLRRQEID